MKPLPLTCVLGLAFVLTGQLKYSNPAYGISFRYPRGYVAHEGNLGKNDPGWGYLGSIPMEFVAPGGVRVVTFEAPSGSYPRTDFVNAFFTVSVNPHLTEIECKNIRADTSNVSRPVGKKEISGIAFYGLEEGGGVTHHQWSANYYHGFSNSLCYELGYGLATAGYGAVDGMEQVNRGVVTAILEHILHSVTIYSPKAESRLSKLPTIWEFDVTPLHTGAP